MRPLILLACATISPIEQASGTLERSDIHDDNRLALYKADGRFYSATLSGNLTLDATYPEICKLDPGGAGRTITLDAESTTKGLYRRIVNAADAAEDLTVKDADTNTIGTVSQNEEADFFNNDGVWTLISIRTIALS